jgi:hypothetical protein
MSRRWRLAGLLLSAVAFVVVLFNPERSWTATWWDLPPVLAATASAVGAFAGVWMWEGIVGAARWGWRRLACLRRVTLAHAY